MLRTCGDYVEDMLIFAQCSINILSNQHKGTSTENSNSSNKRCQSPEVAAEQKFISETAYLRSGGNNEQEPTND